MQRLVLSAGLCLASGSMLGIAPEPDVVPQRWELQFDPGPLRAISVDVPGVGARPFLYLTYRVSNGSGQDVFFAPSFEYSDGEGNVIRSGRDVPASVTTHLLESTRDPLTQDQVQIIGDILQGPQHEKRGLVIWPLLDMNPEQIVIYVGGMSGESKAVQSPDGKRRFVVRKTVRLGYASPGTLNPAKADALELSERSWIMR